MERWLSPQEYRRQREREELAARRRGYEQRRDPLIEQAVIAWVNVGRSIPWKRFLREWLQGRKE